MLITPSGQAAGSSSANPAARSAGTEGTGETGADWGSGTGSGASEVSTRGGRPDRPGHDGQSPVGLRATQARTADTTCHGQTTLFQPREASIASATPCIVRTAARASPRARGQPANSAA